jgi:hypothetical protein
MRCEIPECDAPATHDAKDPIGGELTKVCDAHATVLRDLDALARRQYREVGDPRADRAPLVVRL